MLTALLTVQILAQEDTASDGGSLLGFLLPLVLLGGLFYVVFVLPQRRRMKQLDVLRSSLEIGDEVRTIGGIIGTITGMSDDEVSLDLGGTTVRFTKRAIATKTTTPDDEA